MRPHDAPSPPGAVEEVEGGGAAEEVGGGITVVEVVGLGAVPPAVAKTAPGAVYAVSI